VTRAKLLFLYYTASCLAEGFTHIFGAVADHDHWLLSAGRLGSFERVKKHGLSANQMEHFWQLRFHPRALPGGKKNDCYFHCSNKTP
jgi:hypothetical protein